LPQTFRIDSEMASNTEFRARVQRGLSSAKIGSNRGFDGIDAEILRFLLAT
jgi:hypothetical protein